MVSGNRSGCGEVLSEWVRKALQDGVAPGSLHAMPVEQNPSRVGKTRFFHHDAPFELANGKVLPAFTLAYEAYGELNAEKSNAILLFHAMTGTQNACGWTEEVEGVGTRWTDECRQGWWDGFIGPGKALDTDRYFVVCANYLGGCYGSTGPASINPESGKPYGSAFPQVSLSDIVDSQMRLLDMLEVRTLHAVLGGSIGGMLSLDLAARYPDSVHNVVPIASGSRTPPLQRIHNFEQIYAIESDPNFSGGDYYGGARPDKGLALARMISHKTFISLQTLEMRARQEVKQPEGHLEYYQLRHTIESYMLHQGNKFVERFDANSYLRIVDAWQGYDLAEAAGVKTVAEALAPCVKQRFLIFSIDSDVCYYPEQQAEVVRALTAAGITNMHITVHSAKGHDSFLLEPELFTPHLVFTLNA